MRMATLMTVLVVSVTAHADVILSNLPGTSADTGTPLGVTGTSDYRAAVGLTTGAAPVEFASIDLLVSNAGDTSATLSFSIFTSGGGGPDFQVSNVGIVSVPANTEPTVFNLNLGAPFALFPNTSYWFVINGPPMANSLRWEQLNPNSPPTPAPGITFDGYRTSASGGSSWVNSLVYNGVRINVVPEPATLSLVVLAALGLLRRR